MDKTLNHLQVLTVLYVVFGIITLALFLLFPLPHFLIGLGMAFGGAAGAANGSPEMLFFGIFGFFFIIIPLIIMLSGAALGICMLLTARELRDRESYIKALIFGGVSFMSPFGVILGIFLLLLLLQEPVRMLFEDQKKPEPTEGGGHTA